MTQLSKVTMWVAIGANLCLLGFAVQMGGILQLPIMIFVLIYPILGLIALVKAGMSWSKQKWKAFVPLGILVAGLVAVAPSLWLGHKICESHDSLPSRDFETVNIMPPLGMCDGFSHTIFIDPATKEFWVLRTGGIAGKHELFGPGAIINPK